MSGVIQWVIFEDDLLLFIRADRSISFRTIALFLTLNRPGFLQISMAGRGQILPPPPLRKFGLNGQIDLKFGM